MNLKKIAFNISALSLTPSREFRPVPAARRMSVNKIIMDSLGIREEDYIAILGKINQLQLFNDLNNTDLLELAAHISRANLIGFEGFHHVRISQLVINLLDKAWFRDQGDILTHIKLELVKEQDRLLSHDLIEFQYQNLIDRISILSNDNPGPVIVFSGWTTHSTKSLFYFKEGKILFQSINVGTNMKAVSEIDRSSLSDFRGKKVNFYEYDLGQYVENSDQIKKLLYLLTNSIYSSYSEGYNSFELFLNTTFSKKLDDHQSFRLQKKGYCTWESLLNCMVRVASIKGAKIGWGAQDARQFIVRTFETNFMKFLEFELVKRMHEPILGDRLIDSRILLNVFGRREELEDIYGKASPTAEYHILHLSTHEAIRKLGKRVGSFILNQNHDMVISIYMRGELGVCHEAVFQQNSLNVTLLNHNSNIKNQLFPDIQTLIQTLLQRNRRIDLVHINHLIEGNGKLIEFEHDDALGFQQWGDHTICLLNPQNPFIFDGNELCLNFINGSSENKLTLAHINRILPPCKSVRLSYSKPGFIVLENSDTETKVLLFKSIPYCFQDNILSLNIHDGGTESFMKLEDINERLPSHIRVRFSKRYSNYTVLEDKFNDISYLLDKDSPYVIDVVEKSICFKCDRIYNQTYFDHEYDILFNSSEA